LLLTQITKVSDTIFVGDFHDLCPRQTLSQSRRNGIWA